MINRIKATTRLFFLGLLIVFAISLSFVRFFLLSVDSYKEELENKIYQLTELPVEIGAIRANMRGFSPEIVLNDIRVLSSDDRKKQPIKLEELRLGISLMELMMTQQVLPSSWVTLVGVKLSIVRKEDGSLSIVGLNAGGSDQPLWLLKGGRYEVLKSEITWLDKQRHATAVTFDNIDLLIKNEPGSDSHEIHLISQLPEAIGKTLRVSMSIQGNVFETDNINGLVYIKGNDIQLAEILTGEQPLGLEISAGQGEFELWSQWQNSQMITLTGNVQANKVHIKKHLEEFKINTLSTDFNGFNLQTGWQFGVSNFLAKTGDNEWPAATFHFSVNNDLTQIAASIVQLDLEEAVELIDFFAPLDEQKKVLISKVGLKGQVKDFSAYFDTENAAYAINGVFESIFTSSVDDFPQLVNLTGSIQGSNKQGLIGLNTEQGRVFFPGLFRVPFIVENLMGQLSWQQQDDAWLVESEQLFLNTKDAESESKLSLKIPKNDDAVFMDLQSSFRLADVSAVPDYYPVSIMYDDVLAWLDQAFVSGQIRQGGLLVYGELNQFPYVDGQGVFEVLLDATELELKFSPDWPSLTNLNAEILFEKESLMVTATHAEISGLDITHTVVEIPSFEKSDYLLVEGLAEGGVEEGLKFLQQTPLHEAIDEFMDAVKPSGLVNVELDFKVPLVDDVEAVVNGVAHLKQAVLNVKAIDLNVNEVAGDLSFTEKGLFSKKNIKAKTLGFPINIKVDSKNFNTAVKVAGKTTVSQLQKQFSFLNSDLLAKDQLMGETSYQVVLDLPAKKNKSAKVNIKTDLTGVSIGLPGLLKKNAIQKKKLNVNLSLNDNDLLPLTLNYNGDVKVAMNIDKQQSEMHSAHIVYGKGRAKLSKIKGINLTVKQKSLNLSEWVGLFAGKNSKKMASQRLNEIAIVTKDLQWKQNHYGSFEIAAKRFGQQWQGNLTSSAAKGAFVVPINTTDTNKIKLEMAYLNLSELMQFNFQSDGFISKDLPLIDVSSEQLWWNRTNLGALEIETERISEGVRFKRVDVSAKNHKLAMSVDWIKRRKGSRTDFYGTLLADDMGVLLSQLGVSNDLKEASATIEYYGSWPKAPYQFSLAAMDADIDVKLENGRISSIEPGFGRVLGLLAMEQWIKRLTLDFGDLYKKGLSFNSIIGSFKMNRGKARTTNLLVDAIPAQITITGEADILSKTLDHRVTVVPKSSGAVPIAGTIVSQIAGTITQVVTRDYKEGYFFGSKYHVTGNWGDIQVKSMHEQDGVLKKTWTGLTDFSWMESIAE